MIWAIAGQPRRDGAPPRAGRRVAPWTFRRVRDPEAMGDSPMSSPLPALRVARARG